MSTENQSYYTPVAHEAIAERMGFIRKTYAHLAGAVLGFIVVQSIIQSLPNIGEIAATMSGYWMMILIGFMIATTAVESWAHKSTNKTSQYIALALYVIVEAIIFIPIIYIATYYGGMETINQAAILTLSLFAGLTAVTFFTKTDFSFLRTALMVGGFIAIGMIAAGMIFGFSLGLWFSVGMIVLASASILYQTSNIFYHYHKSQYVAASLGLFASVMLLFYYILSILNRD